MRNVADLTQKTDLFQFQQTLSTLAHVEKVLILVTCEDPHYISICLELVEKASIKGHEPIICLMPIYEHNSFYKEKFGPFRITTPFDMLLNQCSKLGIPIVNLMHQLSPGSSLAITNRQAERIDSAVSSTISMLKKTEFVNQRRFRNIRQKKYNESIFVMSQLAMVLTKLQIDSMYIPNGIFHDQVAAALACEVTSTRVYWYEKGLKPKTYYCGVTNLLDRYGIKDLLNKSGRPSRGKLLEAEKWFCDRSSNREINSFIRPVKLILESNKSRSNTNDKYVVIFTSSPDEFHLLGDDWKESMWQSQEEAILACMASLHKDLKIIVRFHPNMVNKSRKDRFRAFAFILKLHRGYPDALILSPSSQVDSYSLLGDDCVAVIVWQSTLGLEAAFRSIPTICLESTEYSLLVPVKSIVSESSMASLNFIPDSNLRNSALEYIAKRLSLDNSISDTHWVVPKPRIGARLSLGRFLLIPFWWRPVHLLMALERRINNPYLKRVVVQLNRLLVLSRFPIRKIGS